MKRLWLTLFGAGMVLGLTALTGTCYAVQTTKTNSSATTQEPGDKSAAKSDAPVWTADISKVVAPKKPAIGKLHGEVFSLERAEIQNGVLVLRQGKDFFPDLEFKLFLFVDSTSKLEGRSLEIVDEENPPVKNIPHVYISWKPDAKGLPKTKTWTGDYVIRLQFGQVRNGRLPGDIYLCLPDLKQSFVAGTFDAIIK